MSADLIPTVVIKTHLGDMQLPCEPIGEYLAITPEVAYGTSGAARITGGWAITHLPTGWAVVRGAGCIRHARRAARRLAELVDWRTVTTMDASRDWPAEAQRIVSRGSRDCCSSLGWADRG